MPPELNDINSTKFDQIIKAEPKSMSDQRIEQKLQDLAISINAVDFDEKILNSLADNIPEKKINKKLSYLHHHRTINKILKIWKNNEKINNHHRQNIIGITFSLITAEIIIVSCFITAALFMVKPVDHYLLELFSTSVVVQSFLLVRIIVKNLFDSDADDKFLRAITEIYKNHKEKPNSE